MKITRGTTPTININVKSEIDLALISVIWVYITQNNRVVIDKELKDCRIDVENRIISLDLSQDDTLNLKVGEGLFQIRLLLTNGTALATKASRISVEEVYKDGVIA